MMEKWSLYSSGIRYADLFLGDKEITHAPLDPETAAYLPCRPLTGEDNDAYRSLTNFDLLQLTGRLDAYERAFASGAEEVELETGERYLKADANHYMQRIVKFPKNVILRDGHVVGFVCPSRERVHVFVKDGCQQDTVIAQWEREQPGAIFPVRDAGVFDVTTRDGVTLSTAVLLPVTQQRVPAILVRTPYGKETDLPLYYRYAHRGYAVVIQDTRGRNQSGGEWMPNHYEVEDGDDAINWIAGQSWSNGRVGMIGGSYLGYVQWAAAASGNPHLRALVSVVCAGSAFQDLPRKGGALVSGMLSWAFAMSQKEFKPELMDRADWDEILDIRPLQDIPQKALGYEIPFWSEWLRHMDYDDFWAKSNWAQRNTGVQIPTLIMSGWFDDDGMGTTEALDLTSSYPDGMRKCILGPWPHSGNARYDLHGVPLGNNALKMDIDLIFLRWFDCHLKDIDNGAKQMPPVEYYTLGDNVWKTAETWPPENTTPFELFLTSGGRANTSAGDGRLVFSPVEQLGADGYDYDPENPATCIIDMCENEIGVPENYTEQDQRQDILCYTSAPLREAVTLTGDFIVELYISSDAVDTDFVVRINDVDEQGTSIKLADGLLSARYRDGFSRTQLMEPGKVYPLTIRTSKLSNTFLPGHRIRLTVTSSAKNLIFPNSNTAEGFNGTSPVVARNNVHHGGAYPSKIIAHKEQNN